MALTKQQRAVKRALLDNPSLTWAEAAKRAGYKSPREAGRRLANNPQFIASLNIAKHLSMKEESIDKDLLLGALWDLYELAADEGALRMWDDEKQQYVGVGFREPDVRAAKDVLKLISEMKGYLNRDQKIVVEPGSKPFTFQKVPESIRSVLDKEYGIDTDKS